MQPPESGLAQQLLEHQAFLQRLARALVGADADDLVQDVWRRALEHPPRHPLRLRGWIARIARNLAADRRRGELRRQEREAEVARPELVGEATRSRADRFELQLEVATLLARLDEPYRDTLLMRYFEGLLPEEIAKRSGLPTTTVKTRLRRGLNQLREALDRKRPGGRRDWLPAIAFLASRPIVGGALSGADAVAIGGIAMTKAWIGAAAVLVAVVGAIYVVREAAQTSPEPATAEPTALAAADRDRTAASTEAPLQERALVTPDLPLGTSEAEDNRGPAEPQIDGQFEQELNRIAQSFLTETPDFPALAAFWDQVGKDATVVADSVKHEGSQTTGELALPNSNVRARFEIQNDRYRIEFASPTSPEDDTAFVQQSVTVAFRGENGIASPSASIVQYHPDTRKQAAEVLKGGQELLIGWEVSRPDGRAQATPLAAWLADGGRWAIGKSERRSRDTTS